MVGWRDPGMRTPAKTLSTFAASMSMHTLISGIPFGAAGIPIILKYPNKRFASAFSPSPSPPPSFTNITLYPSDPNHPAIGGDDDNNTKEKKKAVKDFEPRPNVSAYGDNKVDAKEKKKFVNDLDSRPSASCSSFTILTSMIVASWRTRGTLSLSTNQSWPSPFV